MFSLILPMILMRLYFNGSKKMQQQMLRVGGMVIMALGALYALYGMTMLNKWMTDGGSSSGAFNSNPSGTDLWSSYEDYDLENAPEIEVPDYDPNDDLDDDF